MRFIGNDPNILDAFYKATASGSIAAGKPVIVTAPEDQQGSESSAFDVQAHYLSAVYDTSNDKVVVAYSDPGDSNYGKAVVGTVSGSGITFGTPVVFESDTVTGNHSITSAFDSANNKVVIAYRDGGNSNQGTAIVGTVSGTSISFGSAVVFETGETYNLTATFDDVAEKVVIAYRDVSNSQYGTAIVGTVSGTSISFGTATVFESAATEYIFALAMPNWNNTSERRVLIVYSDGGNGGGLTLITGTVSGTGISFGTARLADASLSYDPVMALMTSGDGINRAVCAYRDDGSSGNGKAFTVRAIDTTNNNESAYTFDTGTNSFNYPSAVYDASQQKVLLVYRDQSNSNQGEFVFATPSSNGEALTFTTPALFYEDAVSGIGQSISAVYDPDSEKAVVAYRKPNLEGAAKTIFNEPGGKVKAIAETAVSQAAGTPVEISGSFLLNFGVAYDSANQKVVVVYRDVTNNSYATAAVATVDNSDNSVSFGTPVVFNSATTTQLGASYDTNAGKIVAVYRDFGNSQYGTAIVGTVSGTSISFGSEAVYNSATSEENHIAYDSTAQKHVIVYQVGTDLAAIVGTVSGTSISFGSEAIVSSNASYGVPDVVYDSGNDKTVVFYVDNADSQKGKAKVGTVSGTSISFGTAAEFEGDSTLRLSAAYDSSAGKVVVAYKASSKGQAAVGTVSGTGISFGTPVDFESGAIGHTTTSYDASANKIVIAYEDDDNSDYGTVIAGAVSGTSITFETALVIENSATDDFGSVYDANAERVIIFYEDEGDSNKGKSVVFQAASTTTNLTTENYIGITDQAYTDGQDATIAVVGCIDRNQTGLTAGQQYFIQKDGTLALTAATPSVLAGTAISATELVVKE